MFLIKIRVNSINIVDFCKHQLSSTVINCHQLSCNSHATLMQLSCNSHATLMQLSCNSHAPLMQPLFWFDRGTRVEKTLMQTLASQLSSTLILIDQGVTPKRLDYTEDFSCLSRKVEGQN
jgi:hypothetical protein